MSAAPVHLYGEADLDALASAISDNDSAQRLNEARARLFKSFSNRSKSAA